MIDDITTILTMKVGYIGNTVTPMATVGTILVSRKRGIMVSNR